MPVSQLNCPGCGAPAPARSGTCAYCGATLQIAPAAGGPGPQGGGHPGGGGRVDVILHGLTNAHVPLLVEVLGRPQGVMAEVPQRSPPAVFGVPADQAEQLRARLTPLGIQVETRPANGPPAGMRGPWGGPGFGPPGRPGFGPPGRPGFRGPRGR